LYKLFLTLRYLFKPLSLVAIVALGLSVMILTFAPSIMNGFQAEFHARIRGTQSDVSVWSGQPLDIRRTPEVEKTLSSVPGVKAIAPYIEHPAIDRHFRKVDYCFLRAIEPEAEQEVSEFRSFVLSERARFLALNDFDTAPADDRARLLEIAKRIPGTPEECQRELALLQANQAPPGEIAAASSRLETATKHVDDTYRMLREGAPDPDNPGQTLPTVLAGIFYLRVYGLDVGSTVKLTTAASESGEVQQDRRFVIAGAFQTGTHQHDRRTLYMGLQTAQKFIGCGDNVTGYAVKLVEYKDAPIVKEALRAAVKRLMRTWTADKTGYLLPDRMNVQTWEERDENLLRAVGMERLLIKLITGAIVVAASASIFLVLFMSVQNKVRELGILRAVGGTRMGALWIFLGQGILIATLGMIFGSVLGLVLAQYVNEIANLIKALTGWHPFPPEVYYLEKIPAKIELFEVVVNGALTLVIGALAATVPAILAAYRPPIRAIRNG
jgi:ABC-type lipoprotein release transport system permease subunit